MNTYSKFSIQNPISRHYLDEWFVHQILINENVLTTRYEFVDLWINKQMKGLYAVEEHFTDNLLLSQNRPPGVILKYDEDEFWLSRYRNNAVATKGVPWAAAAKIKTFSTKTVFADESKTRDFFRGRDLFYQFHFKSESVEKIIDVEKMAAFIALIDVTDGYHGLIWHNLRFYYNAKTDKLEPVAYDLFSETIAPPVDYDYFGQYYLKKRSGYALHQYDLLFINPDFIEHYIHYLKKFTHPDFFKNEKQRLNNLFTLYETELKKEYAYYSFDLERYENRAKLIRDELGSFEDGIKAKLKGKPGVMYAKISKTIDYFPIKDVSLKANVVEAEGSYILQLRNYYNKPLTAKAIVTDSDTIWFESPVNTPSYLKDKAPKIINVELPVNPDEVMYQTAESDSVFIQRVVKYRAPEIK